MSLDVYLTVKIPVSRKSSGIFVREDGAIREISREEWNERNPGHEPTIVQRVAEMIDVYSSNITHNLNGMASEAGIYRHLWRPEELGITEATQLIEPLIIGLALLKSDRPRFEKYNAPNGWGLYEHLVPFVEQYLKACKENPGAIIRVSR